MVISDSIYSKRFVSNNLTAQKYGELLVVATQIRDEIREIVFGDMGEFALEGLYVDEEEGVPANKKDLIEMLNTQMILIGEKYGVCEKKKACRDNLI